MANERIKVDWASVRIVPEKGVTVYMHFQGKPKLLYYGCIDNFHESLENKQLTVNKWILSIPNNICITKTLDLPTDTLSEAAKMIEFELMSLVPIQPEDLVYGCTLLKHQEHFLEVLVYIVRNDMLEQILKPYHKAGIYPRTIIPDSIALYSCLEKVSPANSTLLYIDEAQCHILSSIKNNLRTYNSIDNIDIHDHSEMQYLANNVINIIDELKAFSENITLSIACKGSHKKELPLLLKKKGIDCPITIAKLSNFLPEDTSPLFYENILISGAFQTINDERYKNLNLLHAKDIKQIKTKQRTKSIIVTSGLSVLVLILLWSGFVISNWRIGRACRKVESLIAPIEGIANGVEHKKQLIRALQNQSSTKEEINQIFHELYKFSPQSITISNLEYKLKADNRRLFLKGQTKSLSQAFDYPEAMKKSSLLKQMQVTNVQQVPTPGGSIIEFKAECSLEDK